MGFGSCRILGRMVEVVRMLLELGGCVVGGLRFRFWGVVYCFLLF